MEDAEQDAEIQRLRAKVHDISGKVQSLMFIAESDKKMHSETVPQFHRLLERVAVLEDRAKELQTMKLAVLVAFVTGAVSLLFSLAKGG